MISYQVEAQDCSEEKFAEYLQMMEPIAGQIAKQVVAELGLG